jgi:hypothetical protein
MGFVLRVHGLDLAQLRSMLGSGEEAFCAKVLRTIPEAAGRRGLAAQSDLVKHWKRGVTELVLGDAGEALSAREPFGRSELPRAGPGLSLAFASILEGFAQEGLGGCLPISASLPENLVHRPLFGLEPEGPLVCWGALRREELKDLATHPLVAPVRARGLDLVSLSGISWTE